MELGKRIMKYDCHGRRKYSAYTKEQYLIRGEDTEKKFNWITIR